MTQTHSDGSNVRCGGGCPVALFVIGPGAVGKYSVGKEIACRLGDEWALAHNHQAIEMAYEMYPASSSVRKELDWMLVDVVREAVSKHLRIIRSNVIHTYIVRFGNAMDRVYFSEQCESYREDGYRVCVAALCAGMETRLERNRREDRIQAKPSKRDVAASEEFIRKEPLLNAKERPTKQEIDDVFGCGIENIVVVDAEHGTVESEAEEIIASLGLEPVCFVETDPS